MDQQQHVRELFQLGRRRVGQDGLRTINVLLVVYILSFCVLLCEASPAKQCDKSCLSGKCINGSCVCDRGWVGDQCQHCQGRFKLTEPSGYLTDGPINYKFKTKCTWLIEGYPNSVLRLRFNHFATECSWDHMYVYDGDSVYASLVAVFSGLIVPEVRGNETVPEVETTSGYALLYFFSDAAYNLTGFEIFYSINSCPNNCSGHGKCTTGNSISSRVYCECDKYWKGEACDIPYCRNNCGSPDRGYCDLTGEKLCVCNDSWQGPDCSLTVPSTESFWMMPSVKPFGTSLARASHQAVVQDKVMWVVGGYTFNYSSFQMVLSYNLESGVWNTVPINSGPLPRYGHSVAACQGDIYMFGGRLETGLGNVTDELWVFSVASRTWQRRTLVLAPTAPGQQIYAVEGHSAHCVTMEGGEVVMVVLFGYSPIYSYVSSVQEYNIRSNTWSLPETRGAVAQGAYGHSSTLDPGTSSVFVHGGYKTLPANKYGLVDELYRYEVNTRTWFILKESGYPRYFHSAVLVGGTLMVFGGNTHNDTSLSNGAKCFSADFLAYDIACDSWSRLPKPDLHRDLPRFGHTAVVSNGSMYVFGGFSGVLRNDLLVYRPPSCQAFQTPDTCQGAGPGLRCIWGQGRCDPWEPRMAPGSLSRAAFCPAKAASVDERCYRFSDCASCSANSNGCQWCDDKRCISAASNCTSGVQNFTRCPVRTEQVCSKLANCKGCSLNPSCQWDQNQSECHALPAQQCTEGWSQVGDTCLRLNSSRETYDNAQHYCKNLHGNIASLTTGKQVDFVLQELRTLQLQDKRLSPWVGLRKINVSYWGWEDMSPFTNSSLRWLPGEPNDSGFCAYLEEPLLWGLRANPCTAKTEGLICEKDVGNPSQSTRPPCKKPCALHATCGNCTSHGMECMWCGSRQRCVDSSAYVISFPYGQCLEWQTTECLAQNCSGLRTCGQCLEQPECGWCGDPSSTGRGLCMEGSYRGPMKRPAKQGQQAQHQNQDISLEPAVCPRDKGYEWAFISCPACQCNGHSTCVNGSVCEQCRNLTTGPNCQTCMPGYHGDPTNGGKCQACKCNGHASVCQVLTGKCFCTTKGIKGEQCQLCDSENRYLGNPLRGTCYYNLLIDYQFTFSLIQEDDHHYTAINFMASPEQANKNLDMSINASNNFNLNITWSVGSTAGTISGEEVHIVSKNNIKEFRESFSCEKYTFRTNPNITFYVYVSNFSWPIKIQIAFSQHNSIMDLVQFFVTFFSCFLSLLLVAAVVWKIKQTCWASRRREEQEGVRYLARRRLQQLMRERQQMASRPFASVAVALGMGAEHTELVQPLIDGPPKPIAVEPCLGGKAAVLTVLVKLPAGPLGLPPPGQSGVTVASALIDISQVKTSDFKDKTLGLKSRKAHPPAHQGTCV
ncbi:attractin-like protein 1 isoform X2 [Gadus morhua]|uniref:Attractin like 1 n=1 Tax=Gadus morhua TaxID=8049 RepID=A0A8C5CV25_GADMO|nr:attractin-like protein 1 isoform X2 [Gadus morhua]